MITPTKVVRFQSDPPISAPQLQRLILKWRRDVPSASYGAHRRRHQGHSLAFRDYQPFTLGDDIRKVDWRASARIGRRDELLLRSFEAEEQRNLVIAIDNRREMALPEAMPRLLYALWAARALTLISLKRGDSVTLMRLFDGEGEAVLPLKGAGAEKRARLWCETLWHARQKTGANLSPLAEKHLKLPPAGAMVVISDMLFEDPQGEFARFAHRAQKNRRSLSILQLDCAAQEIEALRQMREFHLIRAHDAKAEALHQFEEEAFSTAMSAMEAHLAQCRAQIDAGGLDWSRRSIVHWPIARQSPEPLQDLEALFCESFPRLPLLSGLGLRGEL